MVKPFEKRQKEDLVGNEVAGFSPNEIWMNSLQN
jgi:hypothetical protein